MVLWNGTRRGCFRFQIASLMSSEIPVFFTHFFPWPVIAVGVSLIRGALSGIFRAHRSRRWPTVQGKVVIADVEVTDAGDDYAHDVFCPVIEYEYSVDGVVRTSRKLAMTEVRPGSKRGAEAILKRYKVGGAVRVYYSPDDHGDSILEPGMRWPLLGKLIGGLFFLASGVALLLVMGGLRRPQ